MENFVIESNFSSLNLETSFVVTVQTGSVTGAGTDANVYLTLNGDKNKITRRQLQKPESGKKSI